MARFVIVGDKIAQRFGQSLQRISDKDATRVFARALNRGGDQARTQVKRSLVAQTGIKYGLINKAVTTERANPSKLEYSLVATGDETNLNLFGAKQRKRGVSAAPWKKRRIFKSTFIVPALGARSTDVKAMTVARLMRYGVRTLRANSCARPQSIVGCCRTVRARSRRA